MNILIYTPNSHEGCCLHWTFILFYFFSWAIAEPQTLKTKIVDSIVNSLTVTHSPLRSETSAANFFFFLNKLRPRMFPVPPPMCLIQGCSYLARLGESGENAHTAIWKKLLGLLQKHQLWIETKRLNCFSASTHFQSHIVHINTSDLNIK